MIIFDRKASKDGPVVIRACGNPANGWVQVRGDALFAVCYRHRNRLSRAFGSPM